jgi:hypothetical protein
VVRRAYVGLLRADSDGARPSPSRSHLTARCNAANRVTPNTPHTQPWPHVTQVEQHGIEFHKLAALAACNGAAVQPHHVFPPVYPAGYAPPVRADIPRLHTERDVGAFRERVRAACAGDGSHLIVSYSRKTFLQTGDGHFSPIGTLLSRSLCLPSNWAALRWPFLSTASTRVEC